jgi:hypothetical protein
MTNAIIGFPEKLAQRMSADMALEISRSRYIWEETGGTMSEISAVDFDIVNTGFNEVTIEIGNNILPIEMSDGELVNPVYFIEFGFGIIGEENPKVGADEYDWEYNVNLRDKEWYFRGRDGHSYKSMGREGINFIHTVISKYRNEWKDYFFELLKGDSNV